MSESSYLIFRRFGLVWAMPAAGVAAIAGGPTPEIRVAGSTVAADEVVGVVEGLPLFFPGRTLTALWPYPIRALSVFAHQPVVVLQPERVPPILGKGEP